MYHSENYWKQMYQNYDPNYLRSLHNLDNKEPVKAAEDFYYNRMVIKLESTLFKYGYTKEDIKEVLPEIDRHYELIPFLEDCKELKLYFFPPSKKEIYYLYSLQDKKDAVDAYLDSIFYVLGDEDQVFTLNDGYYFTRVKEGKIGVYFQLTEEGKRSFYHNENFFNNDLFPFRPYLTVDQFTKEDQEIVNRCTAFRDYRIYIDSKR